MWCAQGLTARFFDASAPPGYVTLQSYHRTCSYDKLRFLPQNNRIVGNITIPCSGALLSSEWRVPCGGLH